MDIIFKNYDAQTESLYLKAVWVHKRWESEKSTEVVCNAEGIHVQSPDVGWSTKNKIKELCRAWYGGFRSGRAENPFIY